MLLRVKILSPLRLNDPLTWIVFVRLTLILNATSSLIVTLIVTSSFPWTWTCTLRGTACPGRGREGGGALVGGGNDCETSVFFWETLIKICNTGNQQFNSL